MAKVKEVVTGDRVFWPLVSTLSFLVGSGITANVMLFLFVTLPFINGITNPPSFYNGASF
jgi:hypothetical protein